MFMFEPPRATSSPGYSYSGEPSANEYVGPSRLKKYSPDELASIARVNALRQYGMDFMLPGNRTGTTYNNFQPGKGLGFQIAANQTDPRMMGMIGTPPQGTKDSPFAVAPQTRNPLFGGGMGFMLPGNRPLRTGGGLPPTKA